MEEERFRRIKHWPGFPSEAIRSCLDEAGVALDAIEHVAINQDSKANFWKKVRFTLAKRPDLALVLDKIRNRHKRRETSCATAQVDRAFVIRYSRITYGL